MRRPLAVSLASLLLAAPITVPAGAAHFPDPVPSSRMATLSAAVTIDGAPLPAGDEVAAFSVHPRPGAPGKWERVLVGRASAGGSGGILSMTVYGDDPLTTNAVEGCIPGEEILLALWHADDGKEYTVYRSPLGEPYSVAWTGDGAFLPSELDFTGGQRIPLRNGAWNLFSYGVLTGYHVTGKPAPTAAQLAGVVWEAAANPGDAFPLKAIEGKYDRVIGNDGSGTRLWNPSLPQVTNLSYLAPGYGYWVKMKPAAVPLTWTTVPGVRATGAESLSLASGWTLTGVWDPAHVYHTAQYDPSGDLFPMDGSDNVSLASIGEVWGSLENGYSRVISFGGGGTKLWNPALPATSTLKSIGSGYGYWVKMDRPGTLTYPAAGLRPPVVETLPASGIGVDTASLNGTANPGGQAAEAWFEWSGDPLLAACDNTPRQAAGSGTAAVPVGATLSGLPAGATFYYRVAAAGAGGTSRGSIASFATASAGLPPDPATIAPPVALTSRTTVHESTRFLYEGAVPVQTGVSPGAIDSRRAVVLRGRVTTREGSPLPGVRVAILSHPEYGRTLTRPDGWFDLAANGGGYLTVAFERSGYLPAQRQVEAPPAEYAILPDVALVTPDPHATTIDLASAAPVQVARGSVVADADGTRQATLLFAGGTAATMVMPDNTTVPLSTLTVRATEYTVGAGGRRAMPGELPPASGYTYAVELSADEAVAAGAETVRFDRPVYHYVENFLRFPVGMTVPVGYYDRKLGSWLPSQNGRVIRILSTDNGMATLDTDGDGAADNASRLSSLGVTDAERARLAVLYPAGSSLWRSPIPHFSPWDCNWPVAPPPDAVAPTGQLPRPPPCTDRRSGSVIDCQNQTLIEAVKVTGTPFTLGYASDRVAGRKDNFSVRIPLGDGPLPASLLKIRLLVYIAGRRFDWEFPPAPGQHQDFAWDGKDAYGNLVQGPQTAHIRVEHVYPLAYTAPDGFDNAFGRLGTTPVETVQRTGTEMTLAWRTKTTLGGWRVPPQGLGGWTLDAHHAFDPVGGTLYLGSGANRSSRAEMAPPVLRTVAGGGSTYIYDPEAQGKRATDVWGMNPLDVAFGPDGSGYLLGDATIWRIAPDGTIATFLDGLSWPRSLAADRDGNVFFLEQGVDFDRVRKIGPDNVVVTIAGEGERNVCRESSAAGGGRDVACDRFPAGSSRFFSHLTDLASGPDGALYVSDPTSIYRISPDGFIEFFAGYAPTVRSGPAGAFVPFLHIAGIDVAPDGSVYVADEGFLYGTNNSQDPNRIVRIRPDGRWDNIAGSVMGYGGDGGPAASALLSGPQSATWGADGSVYIADANNMRIRRVTPDGVIETAAGNGQQAGSWLQIPPVRIATENGIYFAFRTTLGPDGKLYIPDRNLLSVLESPFTGGAGGEIRVASGDGGEVYCFDGTGRHLRTVHGLTGATLLAFSYDPEGRLTRVTDGEGNATVVERDGSGAPLALVAPFGQRTALALGPDGLLESVANPAGETHRMTYSADGLLLSFAGPRGHAARFQYDGMGRLARDEDAAGGFQLLSRTGDPGNFEVSVATALGRVATYRGEDLPSGAHRKVTTDPAGGRTETLVSPGGTVGTRMPDGRVVSTKRGADPRFGMDAPVLESATIRTPFGLEKSVATLRSATLAIPDDPFSIQSLSETVTVNGRSYQESYDGTTRTFTFRTPEGRERTESIDLLGRPVSIQADPSLLPTEITWAPGGKPSRIARGDQLHEIGYDAQGRPATGRDAAGNTLGLSYDGADRFTRLTLPGGRAYGFAFDPDGNLAQVVMPGGAVHAFDTTRIGQDNSYTPPGGAPYRWSYDADRALARTTFPGGGTLDASFDAGGRPTGWRYPDASVTVDYAPGDNTSRIRRAVRTPAGGGAAQEVALEYDGRLLTGVAFSGAADGRFSYAYDNNFFLAGISLASGADDVRTELSADADGRTTRYGPFDWTRGGPAGAISRITDGVLDVSIAYDGMGRVSSRSHSVGGVPVYRVQAAYDNAGRLVRLDETAADAARILEYAYDAGGQLSGVSRDGSVFETYGYDGNGNRTMRRDGTAPPFAATFDNQDRLVQQGGVEYRHDADGYRVGRGTDTFRYSVRGELLEAVVAGHAVSYAYDGWRRRVSRTDESGTTQYLYGCLSRPFRLTASREPSGRLTVYYYAQDRMYALERGGIRYYVATDALGTPRIVTDNAGIVVKAVDFDSYGLPLGDSDAAFVLPVGFAGGLSDPLTGLVRFGYRDYDPGAGRWTAKDPVLFRGGDFNLYRYVGNDPVGKRDPSGLEEEGMAMPDDPGGDLSSMYGGCYKGLAATETSLGMAPSETYRSLYESICAQLTGTESEHAGAESATSSAIERQAMEREETWQEMNDFFNPPDPADAGNPALNASVDALTGRIQGALAK